MSKIFSRPMATFHLLFFAAQRWCLLLGKAFSLRFSIHIWKIRPSHSCTVWGCQLGSLLGTGLYGSTSLVTASLTSLHPISWQSSMTGMSFPMKSKCVTCQKAEQCHMSSPKLWKRGNACACTPSRCVIWERETALCHWFNLPIFASS